VVSNVAADRRVKPPKLNGELHMKAWTAVQLQLFFACTSEERLFPHWRFLALTGVRRGEALGLRWSDVDLEANCASIVQARTIWGISSPKTPGSRRSLDLDPETSAVLRRCRRRQLEERMLWGEQPQTLPRIRLHDLRHTHATLLLANGENPKVVSERLGHASVAFTLATYCHVLPGEAK